MQNEKLGFHPRISQRQQRQSAAFLIFNFEFLIE